MRAKGPAAGGRRVRRGRAGGRLAFFAALAACLLLAAIFAPQLCPYDPNAQDLDAALQPPGREHLLGTDRHGRDMLSRVIAGSRASIAPALVLVAAVAASGALAGVLCGYCGGWVDGLVMRLSDVCLAFPGLVLALAIASAGNGGIRGAALSLAAVSWPKYARIARGQTLTLRDAPFISAARMAGSSTARIIRRHILPNIAGPILVTAMLDIGTMMMELAALSFLGLGAQPPTAEWGSMMSGARSMLQTYPWVVLAPGGAIFVTVALFNLLGDAARDFADSRASRR